MKTCEYFNVKVCPAGLSELRIVYSPAAIAVRQHYEWRGIRQTHGLRSKAKRAMQQFSPHDFTAFKWAGSTDFLHYITVVMLLAVFLAAELNPFYLKVVLAVFALEVGSNFVRRAYYGWNPIIQSSLDGWPEFSCAAYLLSGSFTSTSTTQGSSSASPIKRMCSLLLSISSTQESDQDGTAHVALTGNHLHRVVGD